MLDIEKKIAGIKEKFAACSSSEEKVLAILDLGRTLMPYPVECKTPAFQVSGCQSMLYLSSHLIDGKLYFEASSDALISAGLAALLITVYSGETPQIILMTPPTFLVELGILASLTPSRSNGLAHIHQRMKKEALKHLQSVVKNSGQIQA